MTKDDIVAIVAAYRNAREELGEGRAIGADRVMGSLPKSFKRTKVAAVKLQGFIFGGAFIFGRERGGEGEGLESQD